VFSWKVNQDHPSKSTELFGMSVGISLSLTLAALFLGNLAEPASGIHQTGRLLLSNAIFDGLTVVTTLVILEKAAGVHKLWSIPLAVLFDICFAAGFAIASLWFGANRLNLYQIAWLLIAHSTDGSRWSIGPYFWSMHTTFLPTFLYLGLVLVCWIGKSMLAPTKWFLNRSQQKEINPLNMTARLLALVGAGFGTGAYLVSLVDTLLKHP